MLVAFGAKNFSSFREGVNISLKLDGNTPPSIPSHNSISNIICIKGANGSGKTNIIKILSFLGDFCCHSWDKKPDEEINNDTYFGNNKTSEFYSHFIVDKTEFFYELTLKENKVVREKVSRKKQQWRELFTRENNTVKAKTKEFRELENIILRNNASIISTANQYPVKAIAKLYTFFNSIQGNVGWSGRFDFGRNDESINEFYHKRPDALEFTTNFLSRTDFGIKDIEINSYDNDEGKTIYYPIFTHDTEKDIENNHLPIHTQSGGTKLLFKTLPFYFLVLKLGAVLAVDEFEKDLHPDILPELIKLFEDPKINTDNAQLIFSTHDDDIMDKMGKYRTFIVNKKKSESYGYRLDELKGNLLRNDRPITPIYKKGTIGGVPRL